MTENPLQRHMKGLRLTANQVAWQGGISHSAVSQVYNAKLPLSANVASSFSRSLRFDKLTLLVANALWRKAQNITLNASESAFISAAKAITGGYSTEDLTMILNGGLYFLDSALHPAPKPPPILLAKRGK